MTLQTVRFVDTKAQMFWKDARITSRHFDYLPHTSDHFVDDVDR